MKIVYLHQYFNTPSMSGGTRSYEMAKRFVSAGHEVHIITSSTGDGARSRWSTENIDGIQVHWTPIPYSNRMSFLRRVKAFADFAMKSTTKAVAIGGDIIFATSTPLTIALPAVVASRRLRVPMVFEVRDLWPELPIAIGALRSPVAIAAAKWLERLAYRNAERIVALSPGMAEGITAAGYDASRVHIIPNSCDLKLFSSSKADRDEWFRAQHPELGDGPIILYAGTLGKINGVGYLADVATHLAQLHPKARCVVIGGGAEEELVREKARRLGVLNKNFFMYEPVKKIELVEAFREAAVSLSLFIDLPEMEHNSANKFFDTLASGTAIAINYSGWQAHLIDEYKCGIHLGRDPKSSALKLSDALKDDELLKELGCNSLRLAREKFDRDALALELLAVLERSRGGP